MSNDPCHADLHQLCQQGAVRREGVAGFEIVGDAGSAFLIRLAVIEAAQLRLDFQYYIWHDDVSGTLIAERLLAAADRGVKVRILLDMTVGAQAEIRSTVLAAHPGIEIAFFNPVTGLRGIPAGKLTPVIGDLGLMQSRMHYKLIVADESIMIGGGRNLADTYFGISPVHNMRDLDFVAVGPVVRDALQAFDMFWQSSLTRHANRAKCADLDHDELRKMREHMGKKVRKLAAKHGCPFPQSLNRTEAAAEIKSVIGRMVWAEFEFVADPPEHVLDQERTPSPVSLSVERAINAAQREVLLHTAYLILQEGALRVFKATTKRGVRMVLLTNSMASVDSAGAAAGMAGRRGDVLDSGAILHELDVNAESRKNYIKGDQMTPLGMHTKGIVIDGRICCLGSYNFDPRSKFINTESVVTIDSPDLAARLTNYLREDLQPQNCWHVTRREGGFLWSRQVAGGTAITHRTDPDASLGRRAAASFIRVLPCEDLL